MIAQGVGLFVGAALPPRLKHRHKGKVFLALAIITSLGCLLFLTPFWWLLPAALFVFFLGRMASAVVRSVTLQEIVPNHLLGRVHGSVRSIMSFTSALSPALLGLVMSHFGLRSAYLTMTLLTIIPAAVVFFGPIYEMERFETLPHLSSIGSE